MALKFYGYNKCDSCRRAKKWLEARGIEFEDIDITQKPPSLAKLKEYFKLSGQDIKTFLNRSGVQYRELNMKEKVRALSATEILKMLSQEGRLIKRPLVSDGKKLTVGFDEAVFEENWA